MRKLLFLMMIVLSSLTVAGDKNGADKNIFLGFSHDGIVINPKCIYLLQTGISESSQYGIIAKSLIIDSCQESNLAFAGKDYSISNHGTVSYYEDPDDRHSYFRYKVLGRTLNNVFILFHSGYIGLYRLEEQYVQFDFSKTEKKAVKVLTKLSGSYVPCFDSAETIGNKLLVIKDVWDSSAPSANQCSGTKETITFDLNGF
jgi:hypothetical protein